MRAPEQFRRRARHLLQMARNCQDPQIAASLRVIAADYLDCAGEVGGKASQQQQQVRSDEEPE
jgi:hypothetical protein